MAAPIMTTWRVVTDNLRQIKADDKKAAAAAASAIAPQTPPEEMTASVGGEKTASTVRPKSQDLQAASVPPEGEQCKLVDASGQLPGFTPASVAIPPALPKETTSDGMDFDPKDRWAKLREEAIKTGDFEAVSWSFPVLVRDQGPNEWQPFHWDLIKELRKTVVTYGLSAPFSQSPLENVFTGQLLTPYDICQLAAMILTPTQKLLFTQRWQDLCAQEAPANLEKQPNDPLHGAGLPQLLGQPLLDDPRLQARLDPAILRLTA